MRPIIVTCPPISCPKELRAGQEIFIEASEQANSSIEGSLGPRCFSLLMKNGK